VPDPTTAHLVATSAYAGFQVTIRWVAYPQLAHVPGPPFAPYLAGYQRRVTRVVGPLFAALVLTTGLVVLDGGLPLTGRIAAAALLATVLAATAFGAVPQHSRLARGWDDAAHRRLLAVDTVRVVAALLAVGVAVLLTR
jgi:hypothetical protein